MVALSNSSEVPHGTIVDSGTRSGMALELLKREATNGITGKDAVGDSLRAVRNAFGVVLRAPQQIIPIIANVGSKQRFELWRGGSFPDATLNAGGNIFRTAKRGNLLGAASATLAEAPDVLIDEPLGLIGGAPYHIRASDN